VLRSAKKKISPTISSKTPSKIKHGIAPWRGIADVLELPVFFLILEAAIQMIRPKRAAILNRLALDNRAALHNRAARVSKRFRRFQSTPTVSPIS
jgi:hypothetical protein